MKLFTRRTTLDEISQYVTDMTKVREQMNRANNSQQAQELTNTYEIMNKVLQRLLEQVV